MNKTPKLPEIRKEAFTKARGRLGLSTKDLGGLACLSVRQIEQIENGEMSSFYGLQVKFTAAKKVANLLGLSDEEAFDYGLKPTPDIEIEKVEIESATEAPALPVEAPPANTVESVAPNQVAKGDQPKKVKSQEASFSPSASDSKPASKKKTLLWLTVLAGLVFAGINLQPLFFADQPEEIIVVKEDAVDPPPAESVAEASGNAQAPVATSVAPVVAVSEASSACPAEEAPVSYRPEFARKPADMVYVQARSKQVICVIDASGKIQNKTVEAGIGASFYGKPPFKVLTTGLAQFDIYFQGARVSSINTSRKTLALEAAEVVTQPVDRTDTQQR